MAVGARVDAVGAELSPGGAEWVARWWRGEAGVWGRALGWALAPAELAYRVVARAYHSAYSRGFLQAASVGVSVLSVGNLVVGGSGKTPVTRWLVEQLLRRGARPAVLHGGYAADEPELHRVWNPEVPVLACRDRVAAARQAIAGGATVLVLDDGFQHRRLARDVDVVLVPAESWTRRPRLLPRGPWREPPRALARARVVAVTRKVAGEESAARVAREAAGFAPGAMVVRLRIEPAGWRLAGAESAGGAPRGDVVAVAGIANPELFLANAQAAGARIVDRLIFRDHHPYSPHDIARILELARGRPIVTTAKDAVKLRPLAEQLEVWVLEQRVVVEAGGELLGNLLDELVAGSARGR
jgi:tetraacyldisaccharide 4'-kinase